MSLGTQALVLIRLDAHASQALSVHDLSAHYGMSQDVVREALMGLAHRGFVALTLDDEQRVQAGQALQCRGQPCR